MAAAHNCLDHLKLKESEWTETHGLDCGPYEHGWDEWWQCAVCGSKWSDAEVEQMSKQESV